MALEMPPWQEADEYSIDTSWSLRKSVVIYARFGSVIYPMAYIARPKWVAEDDFARFISALDIKVTTSSKALDGTDTAV